MLVKNAMCTEVQSCQEGATLDQCVQLMKDYDCGAIPILDSDERPLGIVTDRDVALYSAQVHRPLWEIECSELVAHQQLHCCEQDDSIANAVQTMEDHEVRRLPVCDAHGKLCGMLSMGDVVAFSQPQATQETASEIPFDEAVELVKSISAHHQPEETGPAAH